MENQSSIGRLGYIDSAKGMLAILVVFGHMLTGETLLSVALIRFINAFHMPAFFIISGILVREAHFRKQALGEFVRKKAKRLLIPYVVFEIMGGIWQMIWLGSSSVNPTGIVYGILTIHCHVGADWFLPTLFFAELIVFVMVKHGNHKWYGVSCVIFASMAFLLPNASHWIKVLRRILIATTFILIGLIGKAWFAHKSKIITIVSFTTILLVAYINGTVGIATTAFNDPLFFLGGSLSGSYWILQLANRITEAHKEASAFFQSVGRASLVIMGTHQNVLVPFNAFWGGWNTTWGYIAVICITLVVEKYLIHFCKKHIPSWVGIRTK